MNSILKTATALTIAATSLGALAAPSEAGTGHIDGYTVDVVESGSWSAPDFITVFGPRGKEQITVTCAPFKWSSYGANSEAFVDSIARAWCF